MVRKIGSGHEYNESSSVVSIMPALRHGGREFNGRRENATVDTGSMQENIRLGFTSRTCTSLWERTDYGMQLHTATLP